MPSEKLLREHERAATRKSAPPTPQQALFQEAGRLPPVEKVEDPWEMNPAQRAQYMAHLRSLDGELYSIQLEGSASAGGRPAIPEGQLRKLTGLTGLRAATEY